MVASFILNTATTLTLIRLVISPILMPLLIIYYLPASTIVTALIITTVFLMFSLTDFLDGYIARSRHQETEFGRLLDPVADKMLVASTLIALVAIDKLLAFWAILIIGREFFVMGLREVALNQGFSIPVNITGKLKTAAQFVFLTFALVNPAHCLGSIAFICDIIETTLLSITLILTLVSGYSYYSLFMSALKKA